MSDASPVRAGESMILGSGAQLPLMDLDAVGLPASAYANEEARGRFTGERLFLENPRLYGAIAKLLARGTPYREIGDICEVSTNTVCGVAYREGIPIETIRERIGRLGMDVAQLTLEAIRDLLADPIARSRISAKDLAVIHGIAFSNAQLAVGGATARIENAEAPTAGHEEYLDFIGAKNVTGTGLRAGKPGQKGAAPGEPGGPPLNLPNAPETPIDPPTGDR